MSALAYARLLAAANRGVKRADASVGVIAAAVSQRTGGRGGTMVDVDFLDGLYKAGARDSFDLLGMHAYLGGFAPDADPNTCSPMCFRDVERFRAVMDHNGDTAKQAFVTEMGALEKASVDLGPYAWMELPSDVRADYLVKALQMANARYRWIRGRLRHGAVEPSNDREVLVQPAERQWHAAPRSGPLRRRAQRRPPHLVFASPSRSATTFESHSFLGRARDGTASCRARPTPPSVRRSLIAPAQATTAARPPEL